MKFVNQRRRWSRGLIESFKENWSILFKKRQSTMYIWWNTLFPLIDVAYTVGFIPGLVLACFGIYWIVGPMTIALIPMAFILNIVIITGVRQCSCTNTYPSARTILALSFTFWPTALFYNPPVFGAISARSLIFENIGVLNEARSIRRITQLCPSHSCSRIKTLAPPCRFNSGGVCLV